MNCYAIKNFFNINDTSDLAQAEINTDNISYFKTYNCLLNKKEDIEICKDKVCVLIPYNEDRLNMIFISKNDYPEFAQTFDSKCGNTKYKSDKLIMIKEIGEYSMFYFVNGIFTSDKRVV